MSVDKVKLFICDDGLVHWAYPMLGVLTVCGRLDTKGRERADGEFPTCFRCMATVTAGLEGDLSLWRVTSDPTRKLG